jgi:hypothetical protein
MNAQAIANNAGGVDAGSASNSPDPGALELPPEAGLTLLLEAVNRARILGFPEGNLTLAMRRLDDVGRVLRALLCCVHKDIVREHEASRPYPTGIASGGNCTWARSWSGDSNGAPRTRSQS